MNAIDIALAVPVEDAVRATRDAAVGAAYSEAERLVTRSRKNRSRLSADEQNLAVQLLALRIEFAAGLDGFGSVLGLRRWGATWDAIGQAVGMSRQAAYKRWGATVRSTLDRYGTGNLGGPVADDEEGLDA